MDLHSDPEPALTLPNASLQAGRGPSLDLIAIRAHVEHIHRLAAPLAGKRKLIVAGFGEDPDRANPKTEKLGGPLLPIVTHVAVGDMQGMVRAITDVARQPHYNAYSPLAVFRADLPNGKKGSEGEILSVLGLVADFDDADAARWADRLPLPPNYVLETSAGRFQAFHFFETPQQPGDVKPVAERLKAFASCDHGTADLSHVWRIPGCLNRPNGRKIAGGRSREPQLVKVFSSWDGSAVSLPDLAAALALARPTANCTANDSPRISGSAANRAGWADFEGETAHDDGADRVGGDADAALIRAIVKSLPKRLREGIAQPARGDRSRNLFFVIKSLIAREFDDGTIKRITQHYPDGIGAKYVGRPDLDREIARIRAKHSRRRAAEADAAAARGIARPVIQVWGGALPAVVDQAEAALINRDPELYEFGDELVRPAMLPIRIARDRETAGLRLVTIGINELIERMTKAADFQRFDKRSEEFVSIDCPKPVAATYLERIGERRLCKLTAITTCPVLRPDGTILNRVGFDEQTGILFDPRGAVFPAIPVTPTKAEASAALAELKLLISEFPFVDAASRSVALSGMLTAVSRLAVSFAPMHAFDAPSAGTGKSKLIDCCSLNATGHEAPVIAQGKTEEEMEKRLGAALIAGDRIISIDNCERPLGGELLCQALTQRLLKPRVLGQSKNVTVPNAALYFARGNNLRLTGDMPRRASVGRLDAGVERPENREFTIEDPVYTLKRERPRYVAACLTILRAYIVAGAPGQARPLGGFEKWSRLVRDALIWLGEADPLDTMERTREQDPQREALTAVLDQWSAVLQNKRVSAKQLIDTATDFDAKESFDAKKRFLHPEFREALLIVAADAGHINSRRLGRWLSDNQGKIVDGLRLIVDGHSGGVALYRLQKTDCTRMGVIR
jgi:RepB DNA-primase from phage plasmid